VDFNSKADKGGGSETLVHLNRPQKASR
jgi:hypothetical protein